jgi:hypothetical protein
MRASSAVSIGPGFLLARQQECQVQCRECAGKRNPALALLILVVSPRLALTKRTRHARAVDATGADSVVSVVHGKVHVVLRPLSEAWHNDCSGKETKG